MSAPPPPPPARDGRTVVNWAATYSARPTRFYEPESVAEVQAIVRAAAADGLTVRVVGSAHSPNDCAMTDGVMLSLDRLNRVLVVDAAARLVKVEAGIKLWRLHEVLDAHGLAFDNLGSISEQSFAGLICTGTHGTGVDKPSIHACVRELQLVLADGSLAVASRDVNPDLFSAALCSLGVLGVIVGAVFAPVPAFDIGSIQEPTTLAAVMADLPARMRSAEYYRFWWFPHTDSALEWRGSKLPPALHRRQPAPALSLAGARRAVDDAASWLVNMAFGFHALQAALWASLWLPWLVPLINKLWFAVQFGRPVAAVDRSDRQFNFNCLFKQHVDEWAVPVEALPDALARLRSLVAPRSAGGKGYRAHFPVEVRFVAPDGAWLSPAHGAGVVAYIGIIAYKPYGWEVDHQRYFRDFEAALVPLGGRPHWAKDFHLRGDGDFARLYPRWADFKALRARLDPRGVFLNGWARRTLGVPADAAAASGEGAAGGSAQQLYVSSASSGEGGGDVSRTASSTSTSNRKAVSGGDLSTSSSSSVSVSTSTPAKAALTVVTGAASCASATTFLDEGGDSGGAGGRPLPPSPATFRSSTGTALSSARSSPLAADGADGCTGGVPLTPDSLSAGGRGR